MAKNKKRKFVMARLDGRPKKEAKKYWDDVEEKSDKLKKELFPEESLPPEMLQFPDLDIEGHNMAVALTADNWDKVDETQYILNLKKELEALVHAIYKTNDPKELAKRIQAAIEEKHRSLN